MDASIIVCTYNRSESLKTTLACLSRLNTPEDQQWEVIIVDNNSNDNTRQLVESESKINDFLRYEFESRQATRS
jgi:glycosyltransferase involved in cell wall biosynthesis